MPILYRFNFFCLPFELSELIQHTLRTELHLYEIDIFLNWQKDRAFSKSLKPIKRHPCSPSPYPWCKLRYHQDRQ